jgi:hypothetical protein
MNLDPAEQHFPKLSVPCQIKAIKRGNSSKLHLLVKDGESESWIPYEELKRRSPVDLCHYLLSKIKWTK